MQCLASSVPDNFALCTRFEPRLHPGHKPHFPRVLNPTVCDRFELRLKRQNTKRQKGKKTKRQKDKKTKGQKDKRTHHIFLKHEIYQGFMTIIIIMKMWMMLTN